MCIRDRELPSLMCTHGISWSQHNQWPRRTGAVDVTLIYHVYTSGIYPPWCVYHEVNTTYWCSGCDAVWRLVSNVNFSESNTLAFACWLWQWTTGRLQQNTSTLRSHRLVSLSTQCSTSSLTAVSHGRQDTSYNHDNNNLSLNKTLKLPSDYNVRYNCLVLELLQPQNIGRFYTYHIRIN